MFLRREGTSQPLSRSRLVLVTGGARSGKSRFAQDLAEKISCNRRLFVATAVACDPEMKKKIARHRRQRLRLAEAAPRPSGQRNGHWKTLEEPLQLPERFPPAVSSKTVFLFDCMPTFITNHLVAGQTTSKILQRIHRIVRFFRRSGASAVLVTNEVGLGVVPDHPLGRKFRDLLGEVNQVMAREADEVHWMVSGIPWRIK